MSNCTLSFDTSIIWKKFYRRNNKNSKNKHLLCFPDHLNFEHRVFCYIATNQSNRFCGQKIILYSYADGNEDLKIYGNFSEFDDENEINVGEYVSFDYFEDIIAPFYFAKEIVYLC